MSPASLASSVEWAQSALMEIEHLAATEAKVFDKEAYTNPSVWAVADHPASQVSTKGRATEEYAHLALSGSDVAELERLREIEGLADRVEEAREAAGFHGDLPNARTACENSKPSHRRRAGGGEMLLVRLVAES